MPFQSPQRPVRHTDPAEEAAMLEAIDRWLDPAIVDPAQLEPLLGPLPGALLQATPVSPRVNSVRSEGPECLEPAPIPAPSPGSPQLSLGLD